jgi:hypothetical protein
MRVYFKTMMMSQGCQLLVLISIGAHDLWFTILHTTLFVLRTILFSYHNMEVLYFS